jgi:hypothetical protein
MIPPATLAHECQTDAERGDHAIRSGAVVVAWNGIHAAGARRAAARARPDWSLLGSVAAVRRFVAVLAGHTADGFGGLAELHAAVEVQAELAVVIDAMARHLLDHEDASYREVGLALGLSLSAAAKRYPDAGSRRPGGQPARLR